MKTALVLNSCFFGFYTHFGFARALEAAGVEIHALGGTSAGSIVAAAMASGLSAAQGLEFACSFKPTDFWDPDSLAGSVLRLGRVRGQLFERILGENLLVGRIEDCPRPLVIATTALPLMTPLILSRGPLARAVRASCSVPLIFQPVRLGANVLVDGGLVIEAPLRAIVERHRIERAILHFAWWHRATGPVRMSPALKREIAWARSRGVEVTVARTEYPRIEPERLDGVDEAIAVGKRSAERLLAGSRPGRTSVIRDDSLPRGLDDRRAFERVGGDASRLSFGIVPAGSDDRWASSGSAGSNGS